MVPTNRSAIALARGARTGDWMIWMLLHVKTVSKAALNLASRSRIKNRNRRPASSRSWAGCGPVEWATRPSGAR